MNDPRVHAWLDALIERHTAALTRSELLKAIRALSVRYVERRAELRRRSPIDSDGKRAAFATFYAPLHLLATQQVIAALDPPAVARLTDLGCGTGVAGAAWAMAAGAPGANTARLTGIDLDKWALGEAQWNWSMLGLSGRTRRGSLIEALEPARPGRRADGGQARESRRATRGTGIILGWSINELSNAERDALLPQLLRAASTGATVIVIEPIAKAATPWWPGWATRFEQDGGRADQWTFEARLPRPLAALDADAGFHRRVIKVRTLALGLTAPSS